MKKNVIIEDIKRIRELMGQTIIEAVDPGPSSFLNVAKRILSWLDDLAIEGKSVKAVDGESLTKGYSLLKSAANDEQALDALLTLSKASDELSQMINPRIFSSMMRSQKYSDLITNTENAMVDFLAQGGDINRVRQQVEGAVNAGVTDQRLRELTKEQLLNRIEEKMPNKPIKKVPLPSDSELRPSNDAIAEILISRDNTEQAFIDFFKNRLKKFKLPNLEDEKIDEFFEAVESFTREKYKTELSNTKIKQNEVLEYFKQRPQRVQKQILEDVSKQIYSGNFPDNIKNAFKFWNNPDLKIKASYFDRLKYSLQMAGYFTLADTILEGLREYHDHVNKKDPTRPIGGWETKVAGKMATVFVPGLNALVNSMYFIDSFGRYLYDVFLKKSKGETDGQEETSDEDDIMIQRKNKKTQ